MHVHVSETELKRKLHRSVTIVLSLLESRQNYYHVGIVTLPSLELVVNRIACSICSNGGGGREGVFIDKNIILVQLLSLNFL